MTANQSSPRWKAVLFDFDGTVADCFEDITHAVNQAMRAMGLPEHSHERVLSFVGSGVGHLVSCAVGPDSQERAPEALAHIAAYFKAHPADHSRLYDGIEDLLLALRAAGVKTAVVSNKRDNLVQLVGGILGLDKLMDEMIGELEGVPRKPDPTMLLNACAALGCAPEDAVMVGDGLQDLEAAANGELDAIGVTWGMSDRAKLETAPTVALADSVSDLQELLLGS